MLLDEHWTLTNLFDLANVTKSKFTNLIGS